MCEPQSLTIWIIETIHDKLKQNNKSSAIPSPQSTVGKPSRCTFRQLKSWQCVRRIKTISASISFLFIFSIVLHLSPFFYRILFDVVLAVKNRTAKCKFTILLLQFTIHIVLHHVMCCVIEFVPLFFFASPSENASFLLLLISNDPQKREEDKLRNNFPQNKPFRWTCNGTKPI